MNLVLQKGRKKVVVLITEENMTVWAGTPEQFSDNATPTTDQDVWVLESTVAGLKIVSGPGAPYEWSSGKSVPEELHDDIRWALPHLSGVAGLEFAVAEALDERAPDGLSNPDNNGF